MKNERSAFIPGEVEQQIDLLMRVPNRWSGSSPDARLICELFQIYTDDDLIARHAWQRLTEHVNSASSRSVAGHAALQDRPPLDARAIRQKGSHLLRITPSQKRSPRRWQRVLGLCAMLLIVAALVASTAMILKTLQQQQLSQPAGTSLATKTSTPTLPEGQIAYKSERFNLISSSFTPLTWSPDGTRVATVIDHAVESWDALTGKHVLAYLSNGASSSAGSRTVAWSPDGRALVFTGERGIYLYNANDAQLIRFFSYDSALSEGMPLAPNSALSSLLPGPGGGSPGFEDVAWSPDGKDISAYDDYGATSIWDAQSGSLVKRLSDVLLFNTTTGVREIWQPHGHLLAAMECQNTACRTTQVVLWNTTSWNIVKQYPDTFTFDWSPDGKQLALVDTGQTRVRIVEALTGRQVEQITATHGSTFGDVRWSPDNSRLVIERVDASKARESLDIWSATSGQQLYVFPYHNCFGASWSPDSKYLSCIQNGKTGGNLFEQILVWVA